MQAHQHIVTCPVLKKTAQAFWQADRRCGLQRETIVPKGTLEIIFNLSQHGDFKATVAGREHVLPRCFISGYHTSSIRMLIPGRQLFFGINLYTSAAHKILRLGATDFANNCLDLSLADHTVNSLWNQLGESNSFSERIAVASRWLMHRDPSLSARDRLLDGFLHGDQYRSDSVSALAGELCYSSRQLSRKLLMLTGMNTEQLLLYKKYVRSLGLMHFSRESLAGIAYDAGFSDQSHFIKTFKLFAEMRPGEYRAMKSPVTGHIFEEQIC